MPFDVYEKVKDEIPREIGVFTLPRENILKKECPMVMIKRCLRQMLHCDMSEIYWSIIKERILDTYYGYGCLGKPGIQFWPDGLEIIINGEYRKFPVDYVKRKFEDKEIIVQESLF